MKLLITIMHKNVHKTVGSLPVNCEEIQEHEIKGNHC